MSVNLEPLADIVVAINEDNKSTTTSGIYLPEGSKEKSKIAKIVAVGKDVKSLKVGDKIVYKSYSTNEVKLDSTEYILIKEEDILAKVK